MADDGGLDVGDQIRVNRCRSMPCLCDATFGTELVEACSCRIERVACMTCGRRWTRYWVGEPE